MGFVHEKMLEDEELGVSKEDFEEPENLTIELDCSKVQPEKSESEENDINDLLGIGK